MIGQNFFKMAHETMTIKSSWAGKGKKEESEKERGREEKKTRKDNDEKRQGRERQGNGRDKKGRGKGWKEKGEGKRTKDAKTAGKPQFLKPNFHLWGSCTQPLSPIWATFGKQVQARGLLFHAKFHHDRHIVLYTSNRQTRAMRCITTNGKILEQSRDHKTRPFCW